MKLDYRKTIRVGFAFLAICAFWQMYNNVIPIMLTRTFHMNETVSGAIMAADNVLALFMLPFFGGVSDRCTSPLGRRRPYILGGTLAAGALMMFVPVLDNAYSGGGAGWMRIVFVCVLGCLLVAMGIYRSPAVALMPDVTPKPLRSKANAVINLMGALGGIIYLIITSILYSASRTEGLSHVNYLPLFVIVAGIMILSLLVVMLTVNEPEMHRELLSYEAAHPEEELTEKTQEGEAYVPAPVKRSLAFLLVSVALWFIAYNAVETWFTTYAITMWGMSLGGASLCLTIATAGAILSYIPIGNIASRIGRRKTIMGGIVLLGSCFAVMYVFSRFSDRFHPVLYVVFALVGLAWAAINVNSLPMVLEMCRGSEIGRFTGLYYMFSMAAQIVTPIVAGTLMNRVSYRALFIYSAVFAVLAFVTMCMVRHGDSKVEAKKGLEAFDIPD